MGKRRDAEEATAAREFAMARLAAARGQLALASEALDNVLQNFVDPDDDKKGTKRSQMLEVVDDALGDAARAVQAAMGEMENIDPAEGEPDLDEEDDEDEDDEESDDDEDDDED